MVTLQRSYNEIFSFEILPATGPESIKVKGNTVTLLMNIPYLFTSGIVPPEFVINEVLSKGLVDAGMSGGANWEPYTLEKDNFKPLVQEIVRASEFAHLEYRKPENWVKNFEDWNIWLMYVKYGIPWQEHKRLNDVAVALENEMKIARNNHDEARSNELHLKYLKAGIELSDYVMKYRKK